MQTQNSRSRNGELDSQSEQFIILSDFTECCSRTIYTAKLTDPLAPPQLNVHREENSLTCPDSAVERDGTNNPI